MEAARNGVLIIGWAVMTKEYLFDVNYGIGMSMSPTIPNGSFVFVERLSRRWRKWERGDLVQLRSPTRRMGETITKRILALEGDVVELQPRFDERRKDKITVPTGHVWVEGDNPTCSVDSRHFGAVPAALLVGRPFLIMSKHMQFGQVFAGAIRKVLVEGGLGIADRYGDDIVELCQ